jgi:hypothetical protein
MTQATAFRLMERSPYSALSLCRLTIYSASFRSELSSNPENLSMPRLHSFHVPLLAISVVLLTGSLRFQTRSSTTVASPAFVPALVPLPEYLAGSAVEPEKIFDMVLQALDPTKSEWLEVKIHQRMRSDDIAFEARSCLVRGPNQCARLETTVQAGDDARQLLVVCDGTVLAQALRRPAEPHQVTTVTLPTVPPGTKGLAVLKERERLLLENGCGGPYPLLENLRAKLKDLQMETGLLAGQPTLRLTGSLDPASNPIAVDRHFARPAQSCSLFFDAQSLLPVRIEWRGSGVLLLELEYRDLHLNRPLSHDDCIREFTFAPVPAPGAP